MYTGQVLNFPAGYFAISMPGFQEVMTIGSQELAWLIDG